MFRACLIGVIDLMLKYYNFNTWTAYHIYQYFILVNVMFCAYPAFLVIILKNRELAVV